MGSRVDQLFRGIIEVCLYLQALCCTDRCTVTLAVLMIDVVVYLLC